MVSEQHLRVLRRSYDAYASVLPQSRRGSTSSLLFRSLLTKENSRRELLSRAAIRASDLDLTTLAFLKEGGYLREVDRPGEYTITAKGIWEVERATNPDVIDRLVSDLDQKYFDVFEDHSPLSDRHRVILLTMAAMRAFSKERSVDLQRSNVITEGWKEVLSTVARYLQTSGIVADDCAQSLFTGTTELPVSNLMRHTEQLQGKTRRVFKVLRPQKYYLDVMQGEELDVDKLGNVFATILEGHISADLLESVQTFCRSLSKEFSTLVFAPSKTGLDFSHPRFTQAVDDAIRRVPMIAGVG